MTAHLRLDRSINLEDEILTGGGLVTHSKKLFVGRQRKGFDSAIFRVPNREFRKITAIIHRSGKVIVLGTKSFPELQKTCQTISNWFEAPVLEGARVSNIVGSIDMARFVYLEKFHTFIREHEPDLISELTLELFPSINVRVVHPQLEKNSQFIVFRTGKCIITGVKNEGQLSYLEKRVESLLNKYFDYMANKY